MISYGQALWLGVLQGVTELFPISSLGHSVVISGLAGWSSTNNPGNVLVFLVATHFATAIVLIAFYGREWVKIIAGIFRSLVRWRIETNTERLGWLLVLATIPAGLVGLALQKHLAALFVSARLVAGVLILNGIVLAATEIIIRRRAGALQKRNPAQLTFRQAFFVGLTQVLALIPGFSRTGMTMSGGILSSLDRESAMRFSFLLSGPIILAAAVLKLPHLASASGHALLGPSLVGALAAAVASYISIKFLSRYFEKSSNNLIPFALYCIVAGLIAFILL